MSDTFKIKVRAKSKKGVVKAKLLVKHPMESGMRKDTEGNLIPIHHLKELTVKYKDETVFYGEFGTGVSKDPFVAFSFKGEPGDSFVVDAIDNQGKTGKAEVVIK